MKIGESITLLEGKITVERRNSDYIAYVTAQKEKWEAGKTEAEAIGKLVMYQMS